MKIILFAILILTIISPLAYPTSLINVPINHWSYQFIQRMQAKGFLGEYLSDSKPYSRGDFAKMVSLMLELQSDKKISLTDVETALLEEMKKEFAPELAELGVNVNEKLRHILDWEDGERVLVISAGLSQDVYIIVEDTKDYKFSSELEVIFYGDLLKNLSFYNHSRAAYQPDKEIPVWKKNDPRYLSWREGWSGLSDAYLIYGNSWTSIQVGKDAIRWGPGYHGVVGLSAVELPFDSIKINAKIWKVNFTSLTGFLRDDLTKQYSSDVPKKYLAAHRFEITPISGIRIAWQEAYVYAERMHLALLNPIMPYQMAEDYLGEIGNNTMECDIDISLIPNTKLYSAIFLDDFHTDASPFKFAGWGWAILSGAVIVDPFGIDNIDIIIEYARVEPWTYTHKGTTQKPPIPTGYKHFGEPLGHWMGANADDLFTQIGWQFNKNIYANISYNRLRRGEIGSNIYDYIKKLSEDKEFLGGIVETNNIMGIGLEYKTFKNFQIVADYKYIKAKNKQKEEVNLPETDKNRQNWKAGWNTSENEFRVSVQLKY